MANLLPRTATADGPWKPLGLTSAQRNPLAPELIIEAMNAQMKGWLDDAKTKERFSTMAGFPAYGMPAAFDTFVTAQIALWKSVIDKEGLKLDVN